MLSTPSSTWEAPTLVLAYPLMSLGSYPSSQASHPWELGFRLQSQVCLVTAAPSCWDTRGPSESLIHVQLFATPWTVAHQALLSLEFSRQENCSSLSCPSPGDLPDAELKPRSPTLQVDSLPSEPAGKPLGGQVVHFSPGSCLPRSDGASVSTRTCDPSLFTD